MIKGGHPTMISPSGFNKGPETFWVIFRSSGNYTVNIGFISFFTYFLGMLLNQFVV